MEWAWITFLVSLAGLVFGSTCNILYYVGQELSTNWCPDDLGISIALVATSIAGILPAIVVLNEDSDEKLNFTGFFEQFRRCGLTLFWLRSNGNVSVLFGMLAIESMIDILMSITSIGHGLIKSQFIFTVLLKTATVVSFVSAAKVHQLGFLGSIFVLRVLCWQDPSFADPLVTPRRRYSSILQVIAPNLSAVLVAYSSTPMVVLVLLTGFELITSPVFMQSLPINLGAELVGATIHGTADLAMPSHRAAVVVGAIALVSSAYVGLSPVVISAYIYSQSSEDLGKLGIMFALCRWAELVGPSVADKIHRETGSLLKTGLIAFWCSALSITPAIIVFSVQGFKAGINGNSDNIWYSFSVKEVFLVLAAVLWAGAFSYLITVENRIVSEWSTAQDPVAEQRTMCSIAIFIASLTNIVFIANSLPEIHVVVAATLFGMVCAFLGAAMYTVWFARNDRGPWRLVDREGRELLRVTG